MVDNQPDIVVADKQKKTAVVIDVVISNVLLLLLNPFIKSIFPCSFRIKT